MRISSSPKTKSVIDRYDFIFDTVGPRYYTLELMSPLLNQGGTFVTIISPIFRNVDKYGLISGLSRTAYKATKQTLYVREEMQIRNRRDVWNLFPIGIIQEFELSMGCLPSRWKCPE